MGLRAAMQVQGGAARFAHAYYVCNALMFASYVPLRRLMADPAAVEGVNARLFGYERQAAIMMAVSFGLKSFRVHSMDHLLAIMFSYAQTLMLVLAYFASLEMLSVVVAEVAFVWLLTAQPLYEGPACEALTPAAMETRVLTPEGGAWVVLLQAPWHAGCVHFAPAFAQLAEAHAGAGDALRFGTLDLARWPGLAARYGVDINATTSQLPTVVLYEGGKEADRLPRKKASGGVVKGRWTAADVARVFELAAKAGLEPKAAKKRK